VENNPRPQDAADRLGSGPDSERESQIVLPDLLNYLFVLRQHWMVFLVVLVLTTAAVIFVGLRQEKIYRATTTVLVDFSSPQVLEKDDFYQMQHRSWEYGRYFETQPSVVTSREVLLDVVQTMDLAEDDAFMGVSGLPDGPEKRAALAHIDPVKRLRGRIEVETLRDSMALKILVEDNNPARAADIANNVALSYIEYYKKVRRSATDEASQWLEGRVGELSGQVVTAEDDLLGFRRDNRFLGTSLEDSLNLTNESILTLNTAVTEAEIAYVDLKTRWERARALADSGEQESIPEVIQSPTIQALKEQLFELAGMEAELAARYGDKHPRLLRISSQRQELEDGIARETESILMAMETDLRSKEATISRLTADLDEQQQFALDLTEKELQVHRLERDLTQTETLYNEIRSRSLEADLAGMLQSSSISILDRASEPNRPFKPRAQLYVMIGLLMGVFLGTAVVFVVDRMDSLVRTHAQLESEFKLPVIGIMPSIERAEEVGEDLPAEEAKKLYIVRNPRSAVAESCRTIRTNLMFMAPGRSIHTLLVTSAGPSEGKTSLAANLAYTMASAGKRTLIVDTDMRRPRIHKLFKLEQRGRLTSALIGECAYQDAIVPSGYSNLDLMPLGKVPPNPAELIESAVFGRLVEWAKSRYDRVILDSPPVMAVTDSSILAQFADGVVMVARQDKTNRHMLRQAIRTLQTVNARLFGFVLNDVDLNAARKGYYAYRYRYRYSNYYYSYNYYQGYGEDTPEEETTAG